MNEEYEALLKNCTWTLTRRPQGKNVIGSTWTFKIKEKSDGSIERYKARLCARGDTQKPEDYSAIFAPVIKFTTIRMLLALACKFNLEVHQMDVGNAYLNAAVTEDIYMHQPQGYKIRGPNGEELVCKLKKGLYGLKQAGRNWNDHIDAWMTKAGFTRCKADYCVYVRQTQTKTLIVGLYVDDLIIVSNCITIMKAFKTAISAAFKMKDMGELEWILGMKVTRDRQAGTLSLDQEKYINDTLHQFDMQNAVPTKTPADAGARLSKKQSPTTEDTSDPQYTSITTYRALVGKLVYAMVGSRPDIAFAVSQCSRFFSAPGKVHAHAARRILRYLKGTAKVGLTFGNIKKQGSDLYAYCDSDWAQCPDTRRSTSGYIVMLHGAAIAWLSKRQPTVALSSAEAEYVTACFAAQEVQFIRQLLMEIGYETKGPTTIFCDSQSAMHMISNPTAGRAKHIDIKAHFVKETQERGTTSFVYINTTENAADFMNKALNGPKTTEYRNLVNGQRSAITVLARRKDTAPAQAMCTTTDITETTIAKPDELERTRIKKMVKWLNTPQDGTQDGSTQRKRAKIAQNEKSRKKEIQSHYPQYCNKTGRSIRQLVSITTGLPFGTESTNFLAKAKIMTTSNSSRPLVSRQRSQHGSSRPLVRRPNRSQPGSSFIAGKTTKIAKGDARHALLAAGRTPRVADGNQTQPISPTCINTHGTPEVPRAMTDL